MRFILKFILGLFLLIIIWDRLTRKYVQKYQINMVIGKPGVGKSTFLTKLACDYIRRGYNVYSTEPIQVEVKTRAYFSRIQNCVTQFLNVLSTSKD